MKIMTEKIKGVKKFLKNCYIYKGDLNVEGNLNVEEFKNKWRDYI